MKQFWIPIFAFLGISTSGMAQEICSFPNVSRQVMVGGAADASPLLCPSLPEIGRCYHSGNVTAPSASSRDYVETLCLTAADNDAAVAAWRLANPAR